MIQTFTFRSAKSYCLPAPVFNNNSAQARTVLINYQSSDTDSIAIEKVHVYDGNKIIFEHDSPLLEPDTSVDDPNRVWKGDIDPQPISFGLGVSILIKATEVENDFLEIRSVGIDFQTR